MVHYTTRGRIFQALSPIFSGIAHKTCPPYRPIRMHGAHIPGGSNRFCIDRTIFSSSRAPNRSCRRIKAGFLRSFATRSFPEACYTNTNNFMPSSSAPKTDLTSFKPVSYRLWSNSASLSGSLNASGELCLIKPAVARPSAHNCIPLKKSSKHSIPIVFKNPFSFLD